MDDSGLVTHLAWSPDGKELGYVAFPENGDEPARLYVLKADGSDRRPIYKAGGIGDVARLTEPPRPQTGNSALIVET